LHSLGAWLKTNGEAIFETRPWVRPAGKTLDGIDVRFTRKGDAVYAILMGKPRGREVTIESLEAASGTRVEMLGAGAVEWAQSGRDLTLTLPDNVPVSEAYALKIRPLP
jgi:alpha-L-fucosidase